ncbi:MAG TPA: outer membrane beta-barrel protein [Flavisolibacter sp.]|jgi:hypothetical protein|nr:outer membrane beta-barrel protein [Flavisolibacter sp.]
MNRYRYGLILILALSLYTASWAQKQPTKLEINYTAGFPTGNLRNLTDNASWRGAEGALLFGVTDKLSIGLQAGYQDFYKKYPRQVVQEGGSDISAVITNSIQVSPIQLKAKYAFNNQGTITPYASLAAGANLISYRKFYGEFSDTKTGVGFAAQPELGVQIPLGATKKYEFHLAAGYNYMPFKYNDADGLSHAVIKAGFTFGLQ